MKDVIVIGGGFSGLFSSILLSRAGLNVCLIEKNAYPFHRVCGEYISNEVVPFLKNNGLFPEGFGPSSISKLSISDFNGKSFQRPLGLGGFGISRFTYDAWLVEQAKNSGVQILEKTKVTSVTYNESNFEITTDSSKVIDSRLVISAHGKRSTLDKSYDRSFIKRRSPYVGVKYHIETDMPDDIIELHNFEGGYCGVSAIENGKYNLCYLVHRDQVRNAGNIEMLEQKTLVKNPALAQHLIDGNKLFEKPEVINEITFEKKEPVHNHVLMVGDSAGMITPLCGNGMAMAIAGAKQLSDSIIEHWSDGKFDRQKLEQQHIRDWNQQFSMRLWAGRQIQRAFFGSKAAARLAINIGNYLPKFTDKLVSQTHGKPFG